MPQQHSAEAIIVGIDTHKFVHVAVAFDAHGRRLGALTVAADPGGHEQLLEWARALGELDRFGVEGCGSYGQGLVSFLRRHGLRPVEAGRPDRRDRRNRGKSDTIDAENAARAVLAGSATAIPKTATGTNEMIRQVKIARDTAVKARTAAIISLKALVVTWPRRFPPPAPPAQQDEVARSLQCPAARPDHQPTRRGQARVAHPRSALDRSRRRDPRA
jgi:hypothetical protein